MTHDEMRKRVLASMETMSEKQARDIRFNTRNIPEGNELCIADFPTARLTLYGTEKGSFWIRRDIGFRDSACEWSTPIACGEENIEDLETAIAVFKGCLIMERDYANTRGMSPVHPDDGKFEELARLEAAGRLKLA